MIHMITLLENIETPHFHMQIQLQPSPRVLKMSRFTPQKSTISPRTTVAACTNNIPLWSKGGFRLLPCGHLCKTTHLLILLRQPTATGRAVVEGDVKASRVSKTTVSVDASRRGDQCLVMAASVARP